MAMVNNQAPRQACRGRHICSVRGAQSIWVATIPLCETVSHYSDACFRASNPGEDTVDLFAPGHARRLPDNRSLAVQYDNRGRANNAKFPDQFQVGLGVDVDVRDVVQPRAHVSQQSARRATGTAERTGELHQRRTGSEIYAEVVSGQCVTTAPVPKASVREHAGHGISVRARLHRRRKEVASDEDQRPGQDECECPRQPPC